MSDAPTGWDSGLTEVFRNEKNWPSQDEQRVRLGISYRDAISPNETLATTIPNLLEAWLRIVESEPGEADFLEKHSPGLIDDTREVIRIFRKYEQFDHGWLIGKGSQQSHLTEEMPRALEIFSKRYFDWYTPGFLI